MAGREFVDYTFRIHRDSLDRLKKLQKKAEATEAGVIANSIRFYESLVDKAIEVKPKKGKVYLMVRYPNGQTEEQPIFDDE